MKKILMLFALLVLLAAIAACGDMGTGATTGNAQTTASPSSSASSTAHTHSFSDTAVYVAPTCNEKGILTEKCACGFEKTQTLPASHSYVNGVCVVCERVASSLRYLSNGDGTCLVAGLSRETNTSILVPNVSPLGDTVVGVADKAFFMCGDIVSIELPATVTHIGNEAFAHCEKLITVNIPEYVESIGDYAFNWCEKLETLIIPDSVETIGEQAFYDCSDLQSITIGNGVASIGYIAFGECPYLKNVYINENNRYQFVLAVGMSQFSRILHKLRNFCRFRAQYFRNCGQGRGGRPRAISQAC